MTTNKITKSLPIGQKEILEFPRFGLSQFAERFQKDYGEIHLDILGEVAQPFKLTDAELGKLERKDLISDFHCVTTWTKCDLQWSGYRFTDFFELLIKPQLTKGDSVHWVIFKSLDGYRSRMLLSDLIDSDGLLADRLNGTKLCSKHGAPLRLVVPQHYGYKNPKYIKAIEFHTKDYVFKPPLLSFMEHPRGRVEFEERGQFFPDWFLRYLYRPLIQPTIKQFKKHEI